VIDIVYKDKSRCHEFMKHGILRQIPAKAVSIADISIYFDLKLQFRCPVVTTALPDVWNSSCKVSGMFVSMSTC
jgi:hypothetical protein